jgi:hypothetical protein
MNSTNRPTRVFARALGTLALTVFLGASAAHAQEELTDEHRAAAREALTALRATDQFDEFLPRAAMQLKNALIQEAPNYDQQISATVDEVALTLAGRRADLEREAADIYARNFSIEELQAITQFYGSAAGQKLLDTGPVVTRELLRAAEIWSNGVSRDLAAEATNTLNARLGAEAAPTLPGAEGAAPAPEAGGAAPIEAPVTPAQ